MSELDAYINGRTKPTFPRFLQINLYSIASWSAADNLSRDPYILYAMWIHRFVDILKQVKGEHNVPR